MALQDMGFVGLPGLGVRTAELLVKVAKIRQTSLCTKDLSAVWCVACEDDIVVGVLNLTKGARKKNDNRCR